MTENTCRIQGQMPTENTYFTEQMKTFEIQLNKILCLLNKMLNEFRISSLRMRVEVSNLEKQFLQLKEEIEKYKDNIVYNY